MNEQVAVPSVDTPFQITESSEPTVYIDGEGKWHDGKAPEAPAFEQAAEDVIKD